MVKLLANHTDQLINMVARSGKVGSVADSSSQSNFLGRIVRVRPFSVALSSRDSLVLAQGSNVSNLSVRSDLEKCTAFDGRGHALFRCPLDMCRLVL